MLTLEKPCIFSSNNNPVFGIIGGGIAGVVQAIHLAEEYPDLNIVIFEKNKKILSGTSSMNPGRPTFGFHYRHLETALYCLDNTVKFTKFLRRIGCPRIFADAPQRGIYVLMKDTIQVLGESINPVFQPHEIKPVFDQIKSHAVAEYQDDALFHKLFGPPDRICRELEKFEYEGLLAPGILNAVDSCYETAETTFDVEGICLFLRAHMEKLRNITILTSAVVKRLEHVQLCDKPGYRVTWRQRGRMRHRAATVRWLTLACWERVGIFRKQLGRAEHHPTYNRLKMLAMLEMDISPDCLDLIRPIFVASGPFCMISPQSCTTQPDGRIRCRCACTLAIKTNIMAVPDDEPLPISYDRMIRGKISPKEKMAMAGQILEGAQQFFTCLHAAVPVDLRFGTVRVPFGSGKRVDLHDPESEHHMRDYPGCQQIGDNLYINEAMKLIYSAYNAEKISEWVRFSVSDSYDCKLKPPSE